MQYKALKLDVASTNKKMQKNAKYSRQKLYYLLGCLNLY